MRVVMDKFEQFKRIYKRFVDGTRWLNRQMEKGIDVERDKREFQILVVEPMDALWQTFTDEEKDYWLKVDTAIKVFEGTIV
jgi:hypothetical protein